MTHRCSDCQLDLEPIRILDATRTNFQGGANHTDLSYAPYGAKEALFTSTVKEPIPITAMICPRCRRIALFG